MRCSIALGLAAALLSSPASAQDVTGSAPIGGASTDIDTSLLLPTSTLITLVRPSEPASLTDSPGGTEAGAGAAVTTTTVTRKWRPHKRPPPYHYHYHIGADCACGQHQPPSQRGGWQDAGVHGYAYAGPGHRDGGHGIDTVFLRPNVLSRRDGAGLMVSADGTCGDGKACPAGSCCSQYGFCGSTDSHCGFGCQPSFGTCGGAGAGAAAPGGPVAEGEGAGAGATEAPSATGAAGAVPTGAGGDQETETETETQGSGEAE